MAGVGILHITSLAVLRICSFLGWESLNNIRSSNRRLCSIIDENYLTVYFQALSHQLNRLGRNIDAIQARDLPSRLSKQEVIRLIKRLTPWPLQISHQSFVNSKPQTCVQLKCERNMISGKLLRAQLLSHPKNGLTAFHFIVPDHHFPCMNNSESACGSGGEDNSVHRQISPFTQTIKTHGVNVMYLSCVAYFEVHLEPTFGTENVSMSIGLANPNFPFAETLGGDVNSFGYFSRDGHLYHGDDTVSIHFGPPYVANDVIGCGLVYPPLAADQGEIFFTRNGEIIGVVELLDVGHLDVPWYPIVALNCEQRVTFNYGDDEFRFPILDFEAEELKNRWGNICVQALNDRDVYCVRVYNQLLTNQHITHYQNCGVEGSDTATGMRVMTGEGGSHSQQFDSYGQVIEYPAATMSHRKSSSRQGSLSNMSQNLHTVIHEIPIRRGKRKFEEKEEQDGGDPVRYQRFKTWTQSESAGSWAGSSVNDSWEEDIIDAHADAGSCTGVLKSLPRRDSDRTLSSFGDTQSVDETQSCIAVEGEMTLAEYLQMADSGVAQADDGEDESRLRIIGEDIDNDCRGFKLEEVAEVEADNEAPTDSDDDRSIATSLFVEVASVDGCGSYFGYGGSSDSDNEVQEFYDFDQEDRMLSGSLSWSGSNNCWTRQGQTLSPHSNSERSSIHRHKYRSKYKDRNAKNDPNNCAPFNVTGKDSCGFLQLDERMLRSSTFARHTALITSKWAEDGYDAASETGKGDLTDGMEEDNAVEEEPEDRV